MKQYHLWSAMESYYGTTDIWKSPARRPNLVSSNLDTSAEKSFDARSQGLESAALVSDIPFPRRRQRPNVKYGCKKDLGSQKRARRDGRMQIELPKWIAQQVG